MLISLISLSILSVNGQASPTKVCIEDGNTAGTAGTTCSAAVSATKTFRSDQAADIVEYLITQKDDPMEIHVYTKPTAAISVSGFTETLTVAGKTGESVSIPLTFDNDVAKNPASVTMSEIEVITSKMTVAELTVGAKCKISTASGVPTVVSPSVDLTAVTWDGMFSLNIEDPPLNANGQGTDTEISLPPVATGKSLSVIYGTKNLKLAPTTAEAPAVLLASVSLTITAKSPETVKCTIPTSAGAITVTCTGGQSDADFIKSVIALDTTGTITLSGSAWPVLQESCIECTSAGTIILSTQNVPIDLKPSAGQMTIAGSTHVSMTGSIIASAAGFVVKLTGTGAATFEFKEGSTTNTFKADGADLSCISQVQTDQSPFTTDSTAHCYVRKFICTATKAMPTNLMLAEGGIVSVKLALDGSTPAAFTAAKLTGDLVPSAGKFKLEIDSSTINKDLSQVSFLSYKKLKASDTPLDLLCMKDVTDIDLSKWELSFQSNGGGGFKTGAGFATLIKNTGNKCAALRVDYYPEGVIEKICYHGTAAGASGCVATTHTVLTEAQIRDLKTAVDPHTKLMEIEIRASLEEADTLNFGVFEQTGVEIALKGYPVATPPAGRLLSGTVPPTVLIKMDQTVGTKVASLSLGSSAVTLTPVQSKMTVGIDKFIMDDSSFSGMTEATLEFTGSQTFLGTDNIKTDQLKGYSAKSLHLTVPSATTVSKVLLLADSCELYETSSTGGGGGGGARILAETLVSSFKSTASVSFNSNDVTFSVKQGVTTLSGLSCEISPKTATSTKVTFDSSWDQVTSNPNGIAIKYSATTLELQKVPPKAGVTFSGGGKVTLTNVGTLKFDQPHVVSTTQELHLGTSGDKISFSKIIFEGTASLSLFDQSSAQMVIPCDVIEVKGNGVGAAKEMAVDSQVLMNEKSQLTIDKLTWGSGKTANMKLEYDGTPMPLLIAKDQMATPNPINMSFTGVPNAQEVASLVNEPQPIICVKTEATCNSLKSLVKFESKYEDFNGDTAKMDIGCAAASGFSTVAASGATQCLTIKLNKVPTMTEVSTGAGSSATVQPSGTGNNNNKGPNVGAIVGGVVGGVAVVTIVTVVSVVLVKKKKKQQVEASP